MSRTGTPHRQEDSGELVREFVDHWLALSGEVWFAPGGADDIRATLGEAAAAMAPPSGPGVSRRVVVWSTEELAALNLREFLTPRGFQFAAVGADRPDLFQYVLSLDRPCDQQIAELDPAFPRCQC